MNADTANVIVLETCAVRTPLFAVALIFHLAAPGRAAQESSCP